VFILSGPACVDAIEGCVFWKQIGMCNVPFYQTYIVETCARTCNLCWGKTQRIPFYKCPERCRRESIVC